LQVFARSASGLGSSQLNELLLLLGFDRVTRSFFQRLIDGTTEYKDDASFKSFNELEEAVDRFRQVGLLLFGNVKYAFKVLSRDVEELETRLELLRPLSVKRFKARHDAIRRIQSIDASRTYYLGT
jgi:hypothetical protein